MTIKFINIDEIKPGMILKAVSANGKRYRKVYKVVAHEFRNVVSHSIWSIPVGLDKKTGEWVEECAMVSNIPERIGHMCEKTDSGWKDIKIRIMV